MKTVIIFATILFNGVVENLEYKGGSFANQEECINYITNNREHINNKYPNGKVIMLACGERSNFEKYKALDETI